MKSTEHKPPLEKELIAHIRESLVVHEEQYKVGAWEKFNGPEKSRKFVFWVPFLRYAAAVLVIGFIVFLIIEEKSVDQKKSKTEVAKAKVIDKYETLDGVIETPKRKEMIKLDQKKQPSVTNFINNSTIKIIASRIIKQHVADTQTVNKTIDSSLKNKTEIAAINPILKADQQSIATVNIEEQKLSSIDFFEQETKLNKAKNADVVAGVKKDKFTIGLVLAPSFGNIKKLNMGYGVSLDYNLSPKISLNTGLTYNQMGASKGLQDHYTNAAPTMSALAKSGSTKSLESIEERVTGIDIPLEIKYHVSSNIYANIGVSVFAVIDQNRSNTYIEEKMVQQS